MSEVNVDGEARLRSSSGQVSEVNVDGEARQSARGSSGQVSEVNVDGEARQRMLEVAQGMCQKKKLTKRPSTRFQARSRGERWSWT